MTTLETARQERSRQANETRELLDYIQMQNNVIFEMLDGIAKMLAEWAAGSHA